jgi:acyl dehydratase
MDAQTARETVIRAKLVEVFGGAIASSLVTKAAIAGMSGTSEKEKLQRAVDSICADARVLGMWGAAQAERQKKEWLSLV